MRINQPGRRRRWDRTVGSRFHVKRIRGTAVCEGIDMFHVHPGRRQDWPVLYRFTWNVLPQSFDRPTGGLRL
ncbi:hypothetical protein CITRIK5_70404 [Citricoccus sp. K5]|nr:hypothetical protein CITRIK5_70404 [Citricoccus sp. K5]